MEEPLLRHQMQQCAPIAATPLTPFRHCTNAASVEMNAVVDVLDVGERQIVVQPVGRAGLRKFDFVDFDAIDNAHVKAIIADDFHVFFDLVRRSHGGVLVLTVERNSGAPVWFRSFQRSTAHP